jgi:hypothetical protein
MIDYEYESLFQKDGIDKQFSIAFDGGTITNTEIHSEQFTLEESLCSDSELKFGSCEASSIKFKISNVFTPLKDKWLTVSATLNKNTAEPFLFGKYKVDSDKPTADRRYRNVTAYDAMYDILSAEVSDWYNTLLPDSDSKVTMKQFRDSFLNYFGIEQEEVTLPNDDMTVEQTIQPSELSGQTVITAICEINGCFGHIGRDGKFQYIFLKQLVEGVYPSKTLYPREDLFPAAPLNSERISASHYISAEYEDYKTELIDKLQIRQEENDIGCIYGDGDNCYIVQDNFLVYGKSDEDLQTIAANLYEVIHNVWYRPTKVSARGNPCLEVGDGIRLATKYEIIYTYILQRTLKGIQSLRDTYEAEGEQYQSEEVISVRDSIIQLKGKTNTLTRTVEETKLIISDVEKNLELRIDLTSEKFSIEIGKKLNNDTEEVVTAINADHESIKIDTDRMDLTTSGWSIAANGDFYLGGIGKNAAISYANGDKGISIRNGLSLIFNNIPLSGQFYKFDSESGNSMYNEDENTWDSITEQIFVNEGVSKYKLYATQFPNFTILNGYIVIESTIKPEDNSLTGTEIIGKFLPPCSIEAYSTLNSPTNNASKNICISSVSAYNVTTKNHEVQLGSMIAMQSIPAGEYAISCVYLSFQKSLQDILESPEVYYFYTDTSLADYERIVSSLSTTPSTGEENTAY